MWLALGVGGGFNFLIENEDEGTRFEVEVLDGVGKMAFEICDGCKVALQDMFLHCGEIFFSFGKLLGMDGDKVWCIEVLGNVRDQEHGFDDIEQKEGLNAVHHVVWRVTSQFLGCDTIGPEDVMHKSGPLSDVAVAGFDE